MLSDHEVIAELSAALPHHPIRNIGNRVVLVRALLDDIDSGWGDFTLTDEQVSNIAAEADRIVALRNPEILAAKYAELSPMCDTTEQAVDAVVDAILNNHFEQNPNPDEVVVWGVRAGVDTLVAAYWESIDAHKRPVFTVELRQLSDGRKAITSCPAVGTSMLALEAFAQAFPH